jgi:hypothetical protein
VGVIFGVVSSAPLAKHSGLDKNAVVKFDDGRRPSSSLSGVFPIMLTGKIWDIDFYAPEVFRIRFDVK